MVDIALAVNQMLPRYDTTPADPMGAYFRGLNMRDAIAQRQEAERKRGINQQLQALLGQHGGDIASPELQRQAMALDFNAGLALKNAAMESQANQFKLDDARQKHLQANQDRYLEIAHSIQSDLDKLPEDQRTQEAADALMRSRADVLRQTDPEGADHMIASPVNLQALGAAANLWRQRLAAKAAEHGRGPSMDGNMVHSSFDVVDPTTKEVRRAYLDKSGGLHLTEGVVPTPYHYGMGEDGAWRAPSKGPGDAEPVSIPGKPPILAPGAGRDAEREKRDRANFENPTRAKDAETLKEAETNYQKLMGAVDNFESLIKRYGTEFSVGPLNAEKARELQNAYQAVLYSIRSPEMANTGVLNPGEIPMLEQSLADPTKLVNQGQADAILKQIGGLRETANRNIGTVRRIRGGQLTPSSPSYKVGQLAANPKTGQKIRWNGTAWEPAQ